MDETTPRRGVNRKRLKIAIGVAVALLVGLLVVVLWPRDYLVRQTARDTFHLDLPFEEVRKILVRTEATDEIMALGDSGSLREYQWVRRGLGLQSFNIFNPKWQVHAEALMKVQTSDEEYVGSHLITLRQNIAIEPDLLDSTILLEEGTYRLRDYENITRFSPEGDLTRIETSLTLSILVTTPHFMRWYANRRVLANAEGKLQSQIAAIRRIIEENKDKRLPLPPL